MQISRRILAVAAGAALAMTMAACGGGEAEPGSEGGGSSESITIGIKFDQPGLGQQQGNQYAGFDVEVAKYVAKELGYAEDKITFKESPSAQRETLIESGQVQLVFATYSITDDRKQKVSFGGPYFVAGQDLLVKSDNTDITGPDTMNGKKLCSVTGSTSAKKIKDNYASTVQLQEYDTYSKCVEALSSGTIDAVTTDNVILAGFAAQSQYQGKLKVVGKPVLRGALRGRSEEGRYRALRQGQRGHREDDQRWQLAEGAGRHGRPIGLQAGHHQEPAEGGSLLLTASCWGPSGTAGRPPPSLRSGRSRG